MPKLTDYIKSLVLTAAVLLVGGGIFIYSGLYPIGADVPHYRLTHWLLETMRERSIANASESIDVPQDLNTSSRLLAGGADYNDMCAGCHLKPGRSESDFSIGLYPTPPNLTQMKHDLSGERQAESGNEVAIRRQFWIIKHGIKASGMPAWGPTHSDERIWNMVAFLQRLPSLTEDQYQILTARRGASKMHGH